jgi:hypothetical protein
MFLPCLQRKGIAWSAPNGKKRIPLENQFPARFNSGRVAIEKMEICTGIGKIL